MSAISVIKSASHDDYVMLAWLLRSRPKFLRYDTVGEWVWRTLAPQEEPANPDSVSAALWATVEMLESTFNETDEKWQTDGPPHFSPPYVPVDGQVVER